MAVRPVGERPNLRCLLQILDVTVAAGRERVLRERQRFAGGDSVQNIGIRSALCVPIKYKDKIFGVIHIDSKIANYTFTEDQLRLFTAIGVHTGFHIGNMLTPTKDLRYDVQLILLTCALFLAGLMVPAIFTLLPNFVLIKELGLVDSMLGIALPTMFMTPFAVFFLRQFFMNVPAEIEEAALLDGVSKVGVFFRVILPMSAAPMATLGILTYMTAWNDYFWPLMVSYTDASRVLTVALGVFRAQSPQTGTDWAGLMAATLIAALPMILLFAVFAKRVVNSIGFSGIK